MASYTHEYSDFPTAVMETPHYKDVTDSIATKINQIKILQNSGNYAAAADIIASSPSLNDYIIGADLINRIIEDLRNTQIYAKEARQCVYVQTDEPSSPTQEDVWIGGE